MEEKIIINILEKQQEKSDKVTKYLNWPLAKQRFYRQSSEYNWQMTKYCKTVYVETDEKVKCFQSQVALYWGNTGFYPKSTILSGVEYNKTGRASSRIKFWKMSNIHNSYQEVIGLAAHYKPEIIGLLRLDSFRQIATKGMIGYLFAENITNLVEAYEYYIRYCLRGIGLKQSAAEDLSIVMKEGNLYIRAFLRTSSDPNKFLEVFNTLDSSEKRSFYRRNYPATFKLLALNKKIDWLAPNLTEVVNEISRKESRIKELLDLWERGPVFMSKEGKVMGYKQFML